jgi:uncharacterized repeat protein (TIGR03803 family)
LTYFNGNFHGTILSGGAHGFGEIFQVSPSGSVSDFYDFHGSSSVYEDGAFPQASLIVCFGGVFLCGTTYAGGTNNDGTFFVISKYSLETTIHSFGGSGDGVGPAAPLTQVGNTVYGTTTAGGKNGYGTVFSYFNNGEPGQYTLLHSFSSNSYPSGGLTYVNGELYGVSGTVCQDGHGFVYQVSTSGAGRHVYDFRYGSSGDPADGAYPAGSLLYVNGDLYGETINGGSYGNGGGDGTLYALTLSGSENVLWNFGSGTDGYYPSGGLISGTVPGFTSTVLWGRRWRAVRSAVSANRAVARCSITVLA